MKNLVVSKRTTDESVRQLQIHFFYFKLNMMQKLVFEVAYNALQVKWYEEGDPI